MPYLNLSLGLESIAPHFVNSTLICIDDFERLSEGGIKPEEVLGLISSLTVEKKCQVVLIFNEEQLGNHHETYTTYREKVVDIEIEFSPSVNEAIEIAIPKGTLFIDAIRKYATSLDIKNIRILIKIVDLLKMMLKETEELHESINEVIVCSTVLFAWAYYGNSKKCLKWTIS